MNFENCNRGTRDSFIDERILSNQIKIQAVDNKREAREVREQMIPWIVETE